MGFARLLPGLASRGRLFSRPLGLALRFLHPPAGALELLFGDPDPLPGDLRLQPRALERLYRLLRRGCPGARRGGPAIHTVTRPGG